ncbi:uncharacterized protein IWZ02DRAFT_103320, partial [Phyllosticta citriasiana]|uniref:uncharacterized protein n=1 Tax=Phyllosticta citriasiana TaxID=595635 RepID=UPI0030FD7307
EFACLPTWYPRSKGQTRVVLILAYHYNTLSATARIRGQNRAFRTAFLYTSLRKTIRIPSLAAMSPIHDEIYLDDNEPIDTPRSASPHPSSKNEATPHYTVAEQQEAETKYKSVSKRRDELTTILEEARETLEEVYQKQAEQRAQPINGDPRVDAALKETVDDRLVAVQTKLEELVPRITVKIQEYDGKLAECVAKMRAMGCFDRPLGLQVSALPDSDADAWLFGPEPAAAADDDADVARPT